MAYDMVSTLKADISNYKAGMREAESVTRDVTNAIKDSAAMAEKSGDDSDKLGSNYTQGFGRAEKAAGKFKTFLDGVRDRVIAFAVYDVGKRLVSSFTEGVKAGINYNAVLETSNTKWVNLLGTQEKAAETQKIINQLASKTPYDYEGLDAFAMKLEMAGLGGKDLEKNMIAVGDAVAAVGGSSEALGGVSTALSQMMMKGKVSAEEMQQLAERGIPAWDLLADSMGKSKAEVIELASEGQIMSADVMPGLLSQMKDTFGGSMATQAETFTGKMSTLNDTIAMTQGELSKPLFELLKQPMTWLIDNIPKIPAKVGEMTKKFQEFATKIKLEDIIKNVKEFALRIGEWATNKGIPAVHEAIDKLKPIFDGVVTTVKEVYSSFNDNWPLIKPIIDGIGDSIKLAFDTAVGIIQPVVDYISKFREEGNLTLPIIAGIVAAMGTFKTAMAITDTIGAAKTALAALKASTLAQTFAQGGLNAVMLANPIALVVAAVAALVAVGVLLWKNWDTIKEKAGQLFTAISNIWNNIKTAVSNAISGIWEGIKTWFANLGTSFSEGWNNLVLGVTTAWTNITTAISTKIGEIATAVATFFTVTIPQKFNEFVAFVAAIPGQVAAFLTKLFLEDIPYWAGFAVGSIIKFFMDLPGNLATWLTSVVNNITTWATNLKDKALELGKTFLNNVVTFFTQLPGKIAAKTTEIWNNIKTWSSDMWNKGKEMASNFLNRVVEFFTQLPGKIKAKTTEVWTNTKTWATDMWNKGKEMAETFLNKVVEFFTQLPGKVAEKTSEVITNLTKWVTDVSNKAKDAGTELLNKVMEGVKELPTKMFNLGKDIVDGLVNGVKNWAGSVYDGAKSIAGKFLGGFKDALGIHSPSKEMGEQADNTVVGFLDRVKQSFSTVRAMGSDLADKFSGSFNPDLAYAYAGVVDDIVASNSFEATSVLKRETDGKVKPANIQVRIGKSKFDTFVEDIDGNIDSRHDTIDKYTI